MVYLRLAACYLLVCGVTEVSAWPKTDNCQRQEFIAFENSNISGKLIKRGGPWDVKTCSRLCRQFLECNVFTIEWTSALTGMCNVYDGVIRKAQLRKQPGISVYLGCPRQLLYHPDLDRCLSARIHKPKTWNDAAKFCKDIYRGTKLPEIQHITSLFGFIVGEAEIWLADKTDDKCQACSYSTQTSTKSCTDKLPFICIL